jgi:hypothetical protein
MASHPTDNPPLPSTPKEDKSPHFEEGYLQPEINCALPHEEVNQFRRITKTYAKQISAFPFTPILPRRKQQSILVVSTPEKVLVHSVEDLIDFTINKIQETLDLIPKTPAGGISRANDLSEEEEPDSESKDMEENNGREEEREVPLQENQPWLAWDAMEIPG